MGNEDARSGSCFVNYRSDGSETGYQHSKISYRLKLIHVPVESWKGSRKGQSATMIRQDCGKAPITQRF
jgi:hypothetical protein